METNPLALIIKEKTLGILVTNAKDINAYVEEKLKEYSVDNYTGDAKQAAKDKAEINAAIKTLNDRRIALEKEWNMPFAEFKNIITETCDMMKTASGKLDVIVKAKEEEEKAQKRAQVEEIWNGKKFNLVTLDRVFNPKWLNKTTKLSTLGAEIDTIIKNITGDLASLDAFGEDTAILKDLYLSTLNLQQTLNKGAELKANRERLAQLEAEKKAREEQEKKENETFGIQEEEKTEEQESTPTEETYNVNFETREVEKVAPRQTAPATPSNNQIYTFNVFGSENEVEIVRAIADDMGLEVIPGIVLRGSARQIATFKSLLTDNGIGYNKTAIINLAAKRID
jgi:hypothetical protein